MRCPRKGCRSRRSYVVESRYKTNTGRVVLRRRRECTCGHRFTTYEINAEILVPRLRAVRGVFSQLDVKDEYGEMFKRLTEGKP